MPGTEAALARFERSLFDSIERFAEGLRHHLEAVLVLPPGELGQDRMQALLLEEGRLRRQARRNAPCYDLNRHIAVRRLLVHGRCGENA